MSWKSLVKEIFLDTNQSLQHWIMCLQHIICQNSSLLVNMLKCSVNKGFFCWKVLWLCVVVLPETLRCAVRAWQTSCRRTQRKTWWFCLQQTTTIRPSGETPPRVCHRRTPLHMKPRSVFFIILFIHRYKQTWMLLALSSLHTGFQESYYGWSEFDTSQVIK